MFYTRDFMQKKSLRQAKCSILWYPTYTKIVKKQIDHLYNFMGLGRRSLKWTVCLRVEVKVDDHRRKWTVMDISGRSLKQKWTFPGENVNDWKGIKVDGLEDARLCTFVPWDCPVEPPWTVHFDLRLSTLDGIRSRPMFQCTVPPISLKCFILMLGPTIKYRP